MAKKKSRSAPEINTGSMADIAFLLLIFFLVTTTIASDKGIQILLPPKKDVNAPPPVPLHDKEVFKVLINSKNMLLVEDEPMSIDNLRAEVKKFVNNRGRDPKSSTNPQKAVVSIKSDRGTSYETYISVLDEIKAGYHELRADYLGITVEQYLNMDRKSKKQKAAYDAASKEYPMQISEAEPTNIGG